MASHSSQLAWLDYDPASRDRTNRILALFQQKEARDELGLAAIRDSIADLLFPGTSTIQTRLRYMLFVPWLYRRLEEDGVSSSEIAKEARKAETKLVGPLLADSDELGVFGRRAKGEIKRLPSSVYWAGLRSWGILAMGVSQEEFHQRFDALRRVRKGPQRADDGAPTQDAIVSWRNDLPPPPEGFPDKATLALERVEAEWLRSRIQERHPESLLRLLADQEMPDEAEWPWEVIDLAGMTHTNRELLAHARRFSSVMHGAALVYNLALAERKDVLGNPRRPELLEDYRSRLYQWSTELDRQDLRSWKLDAFWSATTASGHIVTDATKRFVAQWLERATEHDETAVTDDGAKKLVEAREVAVKGRSRSRFLNDRAYDQWGGESGARPLSFRWPTATRFLRDLHDGLAGAEHAAT